MRPAAPHELGVGRRLRRGGHVDALVILSVDRLAVDPHGVGKVQPTDVLPPAADGPAEEPAGQAGQRWEAPPSRPSTTPRRKITRRTPGVGLASKACSHCRQVSPRNPPPGGRRFVAYLVAARRRRFQPLPSARRPAADGGSGEWPRQPLDGCHVGADDLAAIGLREPAVDVLARQIDNGQASSSDFAHSPNVEASQPIMVPRAFGDAPRERTITS